MIGNIRLASERDGHNFYRLIVIQRLEDEGVKIFDVNLRTASFGGLSWTIGPVLS